MIKKLDLRLFFGLLILLTVVSISGCVDSGSSGTQNYNDEFISFDYPGDFQNTSVDDIITGDSSWKTLLTVGNDKVIIVLVKNDNATDFTSSEAKESSAKDTVDKGGEYLSDTRKTNDNGVEVESTITTLKDPSDETIVYKYIDYYFKVNTDIMYSISIYGDEKDFNEVQNVANTVFNSIKVNK